MRIIYFIEQLFFPWRATCLCCRNESTHEFGLCKKCLEQLKTLDGLRCEICLNEIYTEGLCSDCFKKKPFYTKLYSPYVYENVIRTLILKYKSANCKYLRYPFAQIAVKTLPEEVLSCCTVITNVPSSDETLKRTGYDQSEMLAKEISYNTGLPYEKVLSRNKKEKTAKLNKAQRQQSIKGKYSFIKSIKGETVLLIDDVCTTGETLRACSYQLKKAGAKEVFCFTLARTAPKNSFFDN